jgi:hypothetical protein
MEKYYWIIKTTNKTTGEPIEERVGTIGNHPEIARDKVLNLLNFKFKDTPYYSEDLTIQQENKEKIELEENVYD